MYEYQPAKLHTKLAIIDDVVHIGSSNFDYRSLYINMEIMLRIKDSAFASAMRGYFERMPRPQLDGGYYASAAACELCKRGVPFEKVRL